MKNNCFQRIYINLNEVILRKNSCFKGANYKKIFIGLLQKDICFIAHITKKGGHIEKNSYFKGMLIPVLRYIRFKRKVYAWEVITEKTAVGL